VAALHGGYTENEKSWLCLAGGLLYLRDRRLDRAEELLRKALLTARPDAWVSFIALSRLEAVQEKQLARMETADQRERLALRHTAFNGKIQQLQADAARQTEKDMPLQVVLADNAASVEKKCLALEQLLASRPSDGKRLEQAAWYCAMAGQWANALAYAERFLAIKGRESNGRLGIGLLTPGLLRQTGQAEEALSRLGRFVAVTRDPWYNNIGRSLLEQQPEQNLFDKTGESPDYLLTAHVAMAFWVEAGDRKKALRHYKEALGSYMDDRIEYAFARERIKWLSRPE
jgi:tetratricopeptide (TPR) repeat protein